MNTWDRHLPSPEEREQLRICGMLARHGSLPPVIRNDLIARATRGTIEKLLADPKNSHRLKLEARLKLLP